MDDVRIGSRGDSLLLARDEVDGSITVRLAAERLSAASLPRDSYDLRGLAEYFAELADDALIGWKTSRSWASLEQDVSLNATCQAGRVTLTIQLRQARTTPANDGWSAQLDVTLDPGEELRRCASDLSDLLNRPS